MVIRAIIFPAQLFTAPTGHRVHAAGVARVAFDDTPDRHPSALEWAMYL